jgi:hypothetical protein
VPKDQPEDEEAPKSQALPQEKAEFLPNEAPPPLPLVEGPLLEDLSSLSAPMVRTCHGRKSAPRTPTASSAAEPLTQLSAPSSHVPWFSTLDLPRRKRQSLSHKAPHSLVILPDGKGSLLRRDSGVLATGYKLLVDLIRKRPA